MAGKRNPGKKANCQKKKEKKANSQTKQGKKAKPEKKLWRKPYPERKPRKKANPQEEQEKRPNTPDHQNSVVDKWIEENIEILTEVEAKLNMDSQHGNEVETSSENHQTDNPVTLGSSQGKVEDTDCAGSTCPSGQNANQQSSIKEAKNLNLPNSSSTQTCSVSNTGHQVDQKKRKKAKNNRIPQEEKSEIEPNLPVLNHTKPVTDNTKLGSNLDEARQSCSQSIPMKLSDNKKGQKDDEATAQNKSTARVVTVEPHKSMALVPNTLMSVRQKEHIQKTEDITKEKKNLQQKLRTCEEENIFLNEQEQKLLSPAKATEKKIGGRIEVLATDKSVKKNGKESSLRFEHEKESGKIFIKDQNIQFTIHVTEGIQVICKSRTCPVTDLVEDVKYNSGALEDYSTERPQDIKTDLVEDIKSSSCIREGHVTARQEDIKTDSESYCKMTGDTKCDQHGIIKFSNENCPTLDDQATVVAATNALIDSEQHGATGDDTNQSTSRFCEFPTERDSSRIISVFQENIQKISDEFEKDVQEASEKYRRRIVNYLKRYSIVFFF